MKSGAERPLRSSFSRMCSLERSTRRHIEPTSIMAYVKRSASMSSLAISSTPISLLSWRPTSSSSLSSTFRSAASQEHPRQTSTSGRTQDAVLSHVDLQPRLGYNCREPEDPLRPRDQPIKDGRSRILQALRGSNDHKPPPPPHRLLYTRVNITSL